MASLTCFSACSGMILMVKANDKSLVMENTALMALRAARTWGESDNGGRARVISCEWNNRRLCWMDSTPVSWLLIASDSSQCHMSNVLAIICTAYTTTTLLSVVKPLPEHQLKKQLKTNVNLNKIIDLLVLGFGSPSQKLFTDLTGYVDTCFPSDLQLDLKNAMDEFSKETGVEASCLLYHCDIIHGDKGWQDLTQTERQVIVLLAHSSVGKLTIYKDGVSKSLCVVDCTSSIRLVGLVSEKDETKMTKVTVQLIKKNEKNFHSLEAESELGASSAGLFRRGVQGFLIFNDESGRAWSSVNPGGDSDRKAVLKKIHRLRIIFNRMRDVSLTWPNNETYEVNPSYALYTSENSGYKGIILFTPETIPQIILESGRNLFHTAIQKLSAAV